MELLKSNYGHFMDGAQSDDDGPYEYDENDDDDNDDTRNMELEVEASAENKFPCPYCFEILETDDCLRIHKRIKHHEAKQYVCKFCETVLTSLYGWDYHTRKHNNDYRHSCDSCNMKFCTFQQYVIHINNHKYFCSVCEDGFVRPNQLRKHEAKVHHMKDETYGGEPLLLKEFRCDKCGITFARCNDWHRHLKKNQLCRPHVCLKCGTGFLSKLHYQSHVSFYTNCRAVKERRKLKKAQNQSKIKMPRFRVVINRIDQAKTALPVNEPVTNRNPYYCNHCDRTFAKIQLRREHWIRNTDCRPYGCANCSARFVTKDDVEKHVRIHMFKCQFCLRIFSFKSDFDVHECRSHRNRNLTLANLLPIAPKAEKKIFFCQYCEETYYTEEELQEHIEFVSKFVFICSKCNESFHNECTFGHHLAYFHEDHKSNDVQSE